MKELCAKLHPSIYSAQSCLQWFTEAIEHCSNLTIYSSESIGSQFWDKLKNFVLPIGANGMWHNTPVYQQPQHLSPIDCQSLFLDIARDYIRRTTVITPKTVYAELLGSALVIFSTVLLLVVCILNMQRRYQGWWEKRPRRKSSNRCSPAERQLESQMLWATNRSMRIMKTELKQLHLPHLVKVEDLIPSDGSATLVLRMQSKLQLFNNIIHGDLQGSGCLYLSPEERNKDTTAINELKTIKVTRAVNLLNNNYTHQLRLLIVFDEDVSYEELLLKKAKGFRLEQEKSVPSQVKSYKRPPNQNSGTSSLKQTSTKSMQPTILRGATTLQMAEAQHSSILRRRKASSQSTTPRNRNTSEQQSPLGYSSSLWHELASPRRICTTNQESYSPMSPKTKTLLDSIISPRTKISPSPNTTNPQPRSSLPSKIVSPPQSRSTIQSKTITWSEIPIASRTQMPVDLLPKSMKDVLQATLTHTRAMKTMGREKSTMKSLGASQIPLTLPNKSLRNRTDRSDQLSKTQSPDAPEMQLRNRSSVSRSSALPRPSFASIASDVLRGRNSNTSITKYDFDRYRPSKADD